LLCTAVVCVSAGGSGADAHLSVLTGTTPALTGLFRSRAARRGNVIEIIHPQGSGPELVKVISKKCRSAGFGRDRGSESRFRTVRYRLLSCLPCVPDRDRLATDLYLLACAIISSQKEKPSEAELIRAQRTQASSPGAPNGSLQKERTSSPKISHDYRTPLNAIPGGARLALGYFARLDQGRIMWNSSAEMPAGWFSAH